MKPLVVLGSPDVVNGARKARPDRRVIGPGAPLVGWRFTEADIVIDPEWSPSNRDRYWLAGLCTKFGPRDREFVNEHLRPLLYEIPEPDVLPCGCVITYTIVDGVKTMTMSPCRTSCDSVRWVREEALTQGKPVENRRG